MARARIEKSAGGVIYKEAQGQLYVALIATDEGQRWGLPKGLVEKGEKTLETAVREVQEETGLRGEPIGKLGYVEYWYRHPEDKLLYHKFVDFYLLRYTLGDISGHDQEVDRVQWLPIEEAIERASYKSEQEILKKAKTKWEETNK